jgi:gliding motility-associated lipoprotein GldH
MRNIIQNKWLTFLFLLFLSSCGGMYREIQETPLMSWEANKKFVFEVKVAENNSKEHQWGVSLRYIPNIVETALPLKIKVETPSKQSTEHPIVLKIKNEKGEPNGSIMGDICDLETLATTNLIFKEQGIYTITVMPDFTTKKVAGVMAVGIFIK